MRPFHIHTPLILSRTMSSIVGVPVYLKMDALQPIGSYKIRGIGYACGKAVESGCRELISASGGNAGYAVAYAGNQMGVKVTVVMPKSGSDLMRKLIEQEGAEVKLQGQTLDEAISAALELGNKEGAVYIPPYDHPDIWKGHSTMVDEIIKDGVTPEAVVLAVGGGGLLCGVLEGLHRHGCYNVPVLALEPEGASSLYESVGQHKLVGIDAVKTIALSLAAKKVAQEAFEWTNRHPVDVQLVSDQTALKSCVRFATDHRVLVEPACGVALAGIYENLIRFENTHSIVVIVCGGANVSLQLINEWQKRIK